MTRLPVESRDVVGLDGPDYKVGPQCAVPFCDQLCDHAHHIVRRSFLGGPFSWVRMPDGKEVGNLSPLCWLHHKHVTENRAQLVYEDGIFLWDNYVGDPEPLVVQPPTPDSLPIQEPNEHVHYTDDHNPERRICSGCGRPMPKPKIEKDPEEKKARKTWAISVPNEALEDGANVLDVLLEAARDELDRVGISYGNGSKVKYYPLTTALALFVQHAEKILANE